MRENYRPAGHAQFNLTPGPGAPNPHAFAEMLTPFPTFSDPDFHAVHRESISMLAEVFRTASTPVIMQGECVLALEAAAHAAIGADDVVLNLDSGQYGHFYAPWAAHNGAEIINLRVDDDQIVTPQLVEEALRADPRINVVCVVHGETSVGTANPLEGIAAIAEAHDCLTIVDASSSFGGMPIEADAWGLDLVVGAPHKVLGGPIGLSLVHVSDRARSRIEANPAAPKGSFLSLSDWLDVEPPKKPFPFAPSMSNIQALRGALKSYLAEGQQNVWARHAAVSRMIREGGKALGLTTWAAADADCADTNTAFRLPEGVSAVELTDWILQEFGVAMLPGSGGNTDRLVRVGHMGQSATPIHVTIALSALGAGLREFGVETNIGAAVEAVYAITAERID